MIIQDTFWAEFGLNQCLKFKVFSRGEPWLSCGVEQVITDENRMIKILDNGNRKLLPPNLNGLFQMFNISCPKSNSIKKFLNCVRSCSIFLQNLANSP